MNGTELAKTLEKKYRGKTMPPTRQQLTALKEQIAVRDGRKPSRWDELMFDPKVQQALDWASSAGQALATDLGEADGTGG